MASPISKVDVDRHPFDGHRTFARVLRRDPRAAARRALVERVLGRRDAASAIWEPARFGGEFRPQPNSIVLLHVDDVAAARSELEAKGVQFHGETFDTGVCHMASFTRSRRERVDAAQALRTVRASGRPHDRRRARRLRPRAGDGHRARRTTSTASCWASSGTRTRRTTTGSSTRRATSHSRS